MIEAMKRGLNGPRAKAVCDECHAERIFACDYSRTAGGDWIVNEGQALQKVRGMKWSHIKGILRCKECEAKRKEPKPMTENVTPIRQPTREQKREIIAMLDLAYDTSAGRYKGADTDKTVADSIGGGVMPGWVAEIREDLYGPDGGNDEIENIIADLQKWQGEMAMIAQSLHKKQEQVTKELRDFNEGRGRAEEFMKRIEAVKAAVGPKAARA